jgi:hypothetical protein
MKRLITIVLIALLIPTPAEAAQAGQFCKNKDAMKIVKEKGKTFQCQLKGKRYRWAVIK